MRLSLKDLINSARRNLMGGSAELAARVAR